MQRHGLIVADNGSNWYFTGTSEPGWDTGLLDQLKTIPAGAFEAVDTTSLMADPNSGRVASSPAPATPATTAPTTTTRPTTTTTRPATTTTRPSTTTTAPVTTTSATTAPEPVSSTTTTVTEVAAPPRSGNTKAPHRSRRWVIVIPAGLGVAAGIAVWRKRRP